MQGQMRERYTHEANTLQILTVRGPPGYMFSIISDDFQVTLFPSK